MERRVLRSVQSTVGELLVGRRLKREGTAAQGTPTQVMMLMTVLCASQLVNEFHTRIIRGTLRSKHNREE